MRYNAVESADPLPRLARNLLSPVRRAKSVLSLLNHASYSEDGMFTTHVAEFLEDPRFVSAYKRGEATGSWQGMRLRWRVYTCCWAAKHALAIPGDFVECGVNRGGTSSAVIQYTNFGAMSDRRFFLLDTFCGDPAVASVNKDSYSECYADVAKTFAAMPNVCLIRGRIPDTLSLVDSDKVSYLSIDLNNPDPEIAAVRYFWAKLCPGAVVVLDDYAYSRAYESQKRAMDVLGTDLGFSVMTLPTGQGLIVKT